MQIKYCLSVAARLTSTLVRFSRRGSWFGILSDVVRSRPKIQKLHCHTVRARTKILSEDPDSGHAKPRPPMPALAMPIHAYVNVLAQRPCELEQSEPRGLWPEYSQRRAPSRLSEYASRGGLMRCKKVLSLQVLAMALGRNILYREYWVTDERKLDRYA